VTADPDTLSCACYASGAEFLPRAAGALAPPEASAVDPFARSRDGFERLLAAVSLGAAGGLSHGELEARLDGEGRELLRLVLQDYLDALAAREPRLGHVVGADGVRRPSAEAGHERPLRTVFGEVRVRRLAYRARGARNLCPADAVLNLPCEKHSHGLRRLAALEAARGSYDGACAAVGRATGQPVPKRQVEQLAARAAVDFDSFYEQRRPRASDPAAALVISCDGKGVVMRPGALRPVTRQRAATSQTKLKTRLSKGEKRNRKRMAEVGAVYDAVPAPRTAADVLAVTDQQRRDAAPGPVAAGKWLTASVTENAAEVIGRVFDEAERRDPGHARSWVALVDGNQHQIDRIHAEATAHHVKVTIVLDIVHAIEYVWKAAWSLHAEGDPAAEQWVSRQLRDLLAGKATRVAGNIRRAATNAGLDAKQRAGADTCATYLTNKAPLMDYPTALANGWPIATGVIEGACRHLVKDRLDITGARWGLPGAEAVLKLRAIVSNGDFDAYWRYHLAQEHRRVHLERYADGTIPPPA
jgi:hypothetical protein